MDNQNLRFSIIIPVYNRPKEIEELLNSLSSQTNKNFEVVIVEDGSQYTSKDVVNQFAHELNIKYYYKPNTGPGISRNYGCEKATGNYYIFLDSDCICPSEYFNIVETTIKNNYIDAFGGPDKADKNFSVLQKAINYSMTSFLTTGGIRGGSEKLDKFYPRSFNMGYSADVFKATGGFPSIRFAKNKAAGEDMDLSIQMKKMGFSTALIKNAFVYHKRRTNLKQFYNQVFSFGYARISIYRRHPESLKILHSMPSVFVAGTIILLLLSIIISPYFLIPIVLHITLIFIDSTLNNKSLLIGFLSIVTSYVQLFGYGLGFIKAFYKKII